MWYPLGGGDQKCRQMTPFLFGLKIMNLLVFFDFEPKRFFPGPDSMGFVWGGVGLVLFAVYALFSHFWYVGGFGDLGDPVVPTLRGASVDVVTVYAY